MLKRNPGVYCIESIVDGKRYVGSSMRSVTSRWCQHRTKLKAGNHCNKHLQEAWRQHGGDSFRFVLLEETTPEGSFVREQQYISLLKSDQREHGYNSMEASKLVLNASDDDMTEIVANEKRKASVVLKRDSQTITDDAEALLRECLPFVDEETRALVEEFLAREPGRPRKVDKAECKRLRAAGFTAEEIATKLKCHACNVRRCWK